MTMDTNQKDKILRAIESKFSAMSPCENQEWWNYLKTLGVETDQSSDGWSRAGFFLRIIDPAGGTHLLPNDERVFDMLYVPRELAEKILVLGVLP
jgi:hypothetical protein